jgi:endoglucanase
MGSFNAAGMQELVDTIRDTGATNIVIADGIDKAFTLQGVPPLSGGNIAYAIHPYDPDPSYSALGWGESDWDARFGDPAKKVPVIATEFGDSECGDTTSAHAYDREILDYFAAHHISYLAWDWFAAYPCDVPELITNAAGVCRESMGCVIQQALKSFARQRASRSKR